MNAKIAGVPHAAASAADGPSQTIQTVRFQGWTGAAGEPSAMTWPDGRCACPMPEFTGTTGAGPLYCRKCGGSGP